MAGFIQRVIPGIFLVGMCLFGTFIPAAARVYIDIDAPTFQKFPIAVTDFNKISSDQGEDMPAWFSSTLSNYLNITGLFNIIPKNAFLEYPVAHPQGFEKINFPNWTVIGAEYLVRGTFRISGGYLSAEMRLYDVIKGDLIIGNRYYGKPDEKLALVKKMASDILLALSGDGSIFNTRIAFLRKKGGNPEIHVMDFDGSGLSQVTHWKALTLAPRWSPDGRYLSFTSYQGGNPNFYIRDMQTGSSRQVSNRPGLNLSGAWSPDGKKILLTLSFEGNQEIYSLEVATGKLKRLTFNYEIDVSPVWSPDGKNIAFVSGRSGSPQIYIMDDEGNDVRRLTYEGSYNTSPSWSPKGNRIAYESMAGGVFQIFSINTDGSNLVRMTQAGGEHKYPSWSPDGRYLAFTTRTGWVEKIGIMNANGSNIRILGEGTHPVWSPVFK